MRLPDPAPHAVVLLPGGGGLSTAEVFAEADRLGLGRDRPRSWTSWRSACAWRPARAPRRSPTRSCSSTTSSRRRARCVPRSAPRSTRCAPRGPARAADRLGPDRLRPLRGHRRGPRRGGALDRDDAIVCEAGSGAVRLPGEAGAAENGPAGGDRRRPVASGYCLLSRSSAASTCRACSRTSPTRSAPGPTCWSASSPSPRPAPSSASSSPARR